MPASHARNLAALCAAAVLLFSLCLPARAQETSAAGDVLVLVLPFEVNAGQQLDYLKDSLPTLLADALRGEGFKVVDQGAMRTLLEDQQVEFLDLQTARDLALLSGAAYAVYGSFNQVGETISLDVRLVEAFGIKKDKPLFVVKEGLINVMPAVEDLASRIKLELLKKEQIAEIAVEGTQVLDKDVVFMRINAMKGQVYDPQVVNEDIRRIYGLGYFDDVRVEVQDLPEGKRLVYSVAEKPRIQAVSVVGNEELDDDELLETMNTKVGSVLNPQVLSEDLKRIRELYRKDGFYLAEVNYRVEGQDQPQARLIVEVDEKEKLYIKQIDINGAEQLDEGDLKDELALAERGIFSFMTGTGVLKQELLERDAAALEAYYANRGFVDAKVSQPEVEFKEDGIYITFNVQEGPRYKVGTVDFKGDLLESDESLMALTEIDDLGQEDAYFDRSVLQADLKNLSDYYTDYGYAFANSDVSMDVDRDKKVVNVTYIMDKQRKVYVRRVEIEGNTKTRDNVILREMRLGDGDPFSGSKIARSTVRLNRLDFFKTVDVEPVPTGDPGKLDLKVKVSEKPTGALSAGVGYSSYEKIFVGGSIREDNLFGKAYSASFSGQFGARTQSFTTSFVNPHLYDSKLLFGVDAYWVKRDFLDYMKRTLGSRVHFGYPLGEYTDLLWGYRLENYTLYDIEDDAAKLIKEFEGTNFSSILDAGVVRDTTDDNFMPTRGTINRFDTQFGGGIIGGNTDFIKFAYGSNYFKQLFAETVFHVRGRIGYVMKNFTDEDVPPWERFYLGGINTVRGYDGMRISPYDGGDRIGGDKMFFFNLEYFVPLWKEYNLIGLAFFDAGNAWDDDEFYFEDTKQRDGTALTLGLYKSVGVGIRWNSPFGPLRLEYGYPLDKLRDSSDSGKFEFSMGTAF